MFMKVAPFSSVLHTVGEHPILFVAKDTHSLYFDSRAVTIYYPEHLHPIYCGKFDQYFLRRTLLLAGSLASGMHGG